MVGNLVSSEIIRNEDKHFLLDSNIFINLHKNIARTHVKTQQLDELVLLDNKHTI